MAINVPGLGNLQAQRPLISIVMPTYNSARSIGDALESLAAQTFRDFELIIADGDSGDETLQIVQRGSTHLPSFTVLSKPDGGIYDGINRGIAACRGTWVLVLGCDDRLASPRVLETAASSLATSNADLVYGDVRMTGPNPAVPQGARYRGETDLGGLIERNICQQAIFYNVRLLQSLGPFDPRYRVWADWHYAIRVFATRPTQWINLIVSDYGVAGFSSSRLDQAFIRDQPDFLVGLVLSQPFNPRLQAMRWNLLRLARLSKAEGRHLQSAKLFLAGYWLSLGRAVTKRRVKNTSTV